MLYELWLKKLQTAEVDVPGRDGLAAALDAIGARMVNEDLPLPLRLALNYADARARPATEALFALDTRLSELVAKANEPMLAQLRLAWWRDELGKPVELRAKGDPVLEAIGLSWGGPEPALVALVDGWENLVGEAPLPGGALRGFAAGRSEAFAGLARVLGQPGVGAEARAAAEVWALADLAARVSDPEERAAAHALAQQAVRRPAKLPRRLRPLAVLRGLALRATARGGGPLVAGRRDVLAALGLGMFGR